MLGNNSSKDNSLRYHLRGYPKNPRVQRTQVAAAFNKLEITQAPNFDLSKTKTLEYLDKYPTGKVPAFEGTDEYTLFESPAIAWYYAAASPNGPDLVASSSSQKSSTIMQWAHFSDSEILDNLTTVFAMGMLKRIPWDEKRFNDAIEGLEMALKRVETALTTGENGNNGKFLVGTRVTFADIMVGSMLVAGMQYVLDMSMRRTNPVTTAWVMGLLEMPEFKGVFGEVEFVKNRPSRPYMKAEDLG